jgi:hypothetical protein
MVDIVEVELVQIEVAIHSADQGNAILQKFNILARESLNAEACSQNTILCNPHIRLILK